MTWSPPFPRCVAAVPEARFVLVGADRAAGTSLPDGAGELTRTGILTVVERQPRSAMPVYLAMADVLVSPRAFGGNLPLKIFDYLAAGRPIVATDISTHRSVLTEDTAVLVQPTSAALAEGIVSILGGPTRGRELGEAARQLRLRAPRLEPLRAHGRGDLRRGTRSRVPA